MTGSFLVAAAVCRDITGGLSTQVMLKVGSSLAVKSASSFKGNLDSYTTNISAQRCILAVASVGTPFFNPRMARSGLWSVSSVKGRVYKKQQNFLTPKTKANASFSVCALFLSDLDSVLHAYTTGRCVPSGIS